MLMLPILLGTLLISENSAHADSKISTTREVNEEWVEYINSTEEEKAKYDVIPSIMKEEVAEYESDDDPDTLPAYFNLRNENRVSTPRDQGSLGLCWVFATNLSAESALLTNGLVTGINNVLFSERQVDYAMSNSITEGFNPYYSNFRSLGGGGYAYSAFDAMLKGISPVTTDIFGTYNTTDLSKKSLKKVFDTQTNVEYSVNGYQYLPTLSASASSSTRAAWISMIKTLIYEYGALALSTIGPGEEYGGSCYYEKDANNIVMNLDDECHESESDNGHMMALIGWDDDYEYEYCRYYSTTSSNINNCTGTIVSGQGAFIIQNSWGTGANAMTYPYLAYTSEIEALLWVSDISEKTWDKNYVTSDSNTHEVSHYTSNRTTSGGNQVYTITYYKNSEVDEKLDHITFGTSAIDYGDISVYISNNGSDYTLVDTIDPQIYGYFSVYPEEDYLLNSNKFYIKIVSPHSYLSDFYAFTQYVDDDTAKKAEFLDESIEQEYGAIASYLPQPVFTRNIETGQQLTLKLVNNTTHVDYTDELAVKNNYVVNDYVDLKFKVANSLPIGSYNLNIMNGSMVLDSFRIVVTPPTDFLNTSKGYELVSGYLKTARKTKSDFESTVVRQASKYKITSNISEYTGTGNKVTISDIASNKIAEYIIYVPGDINGDGKISALDYVKIKNHIMQSETISGNLYLLAADANSDNKISALDYVQIKNTIMNGGN